MTDQSTLQMPAGRPLARRLVGSYYANVVQGLGIALFVILGMTAVLQTIDLGVLLATGAHGSFHLRIEEIATPDNLGLALGAIMLTFGTVPTIIYVAGLIFKADTLLPSPDIN